jgi:hypothetical protein
MHTNTLTSFTRSSSAQQAVRQMSVWCVAWVCHAVSLAQTTAFAGQWQGVWHIGMSSGKVTMKLDQDAQGAIAFTNLPGFGQEETALQKTMVDKLSLQFAVQNDQSTTLSARLQLNADSNSLKGMGQYAGAGVKLELHKAD